MPGERYNKFIELINLDKIEINSLRCEQNNDFNPTSKNNLDIILNHGIKKVMVEGIELLVRIEFEVQAIVPDDFKQVSGDLLASNILFSIKFDLDLKYTLDIKNEEGFSFDFKNLEKEIDMFIENNALINAWPYARETISSLTARMGFPPLSIPTYKFTLVY